ncbi:hypothetical protein [Paenibacillus spiritus]|nr:hypothetical protein [Paenibacillus spiritus]
MEWTRSAACAALFLMDLEKKAKLSGTGRPIMRKGTVTLSFKI